MHGSFYKKSIGRFSCLLLVICLLLLFGCAKKEIGEIKHISQMPSYSPKTLSVIPAYDNTTQFPTPVATAECDTVIEQTPTPKQTLIPTPEPTSTIQGKIADMSIEEKLGQMVMFGFSGTEKVSSEFKAVMRDYKIGNVILYGPNIDKDRSDGGFSLCKKLTDSLRSVAVSDVPLLIAIDVEGGNVIRFHWRNNLLSAADLGKVNDSDTAQSQFEKIGEGLINAGIDIDLAPVMDISRNPAKTFLNNRIISKSAVISSEIGAACIQGLHNSGCLSLVKHFPGHGATDSDSHKDTPVINKTLKELEEYELIPFYAAVEAGTDGVMVGHLLYPKIDPDHIASQSYFFITELLRNQLGFEGIVMSDDFRMEGLRKQCPLEKAAVNFILAGGDIILCGPNHEYQRKIMDGLRSAFISGELTEARIDESLMRILSVKEELD